MPTTLAPTEAILRVARGTWQAISSPHHPEQNHTNPGYLVVNLNVVSTLNGGCFHSLCIGWAVSQLYRSLEKNFDQSIGNITSLSKISEWLSEEFRQLSLGSGEVVGKGGYQTSEKGCPELGSQFHLHSEPLRFIP